MKAEKDHRDLLARVLDELQGDITCWTHLRSMLDKIDPQTELSVEFEVIWNVVGGLLREGKLVIGDARRKSGRVVVERWPGTLNDLRERAWNLVEELDNAGKIDSGFWIQLSEHHERV